MDILPPMPGFHARIFPLSIQRRLESVPPAASQLAFFMLIVLGAVCFPKT